MKDVNHSLSTLAVVSLLHVFKIEREKERQRDGRQDGAQVCADYLPPHDDCVVNGYEDRAREREREY